MSIARYASGIDVKSYKVMNACRALRAEGLMESIDDKMRMRSEDPFIIIYRETSGTVTRCNDRHTEIDYISVDMTFHVHPMQCTSATRD